jgi:hypothetical protein
VRVLHAAGPPAGGFADDDGDGLSNALELLLGLSPGSQDSDLDGYSDPEEIARDSLPLDSSSTPRGGAASVGLCVYQENSGPVRPVWVQYAGDGDFASKPLATGARVATTLRSVPTSFFSANANVKVVSGTTAGSLVKVFDGTFDPLHVTRFGSLSLYVTVSSQGQVVAADAVNLIDRDGVIVEFRLLPVLGVSSSGQPGVSYVQGVYEPISSGAMPGEWRPGEICAQNLAIAGTLGPVIIQEVVSAACESGWDAYCDPACPATVGTTVEVLDPSGLIGG